VGRFMTFLMRKIANMTVITHATGTIQKIPGKDIFPLSL